MTALSFSVPAKPCRFSAMKARSMDKLILLSVALALLGIPLWASRDAVPARGLKKALLGVCAFNLVYIFFLRVVLPRLN